MNKIPYTNDRPHTVYVGSVSIRAGETRMVDASMLNPEPAPAAAPAAAVFNEHVELLKGKVADVISALSGKTIEQLAELEGLEQASAKPRTGVLQALAAEKLRLSQLPA